MKEIRLLGKRIDLENSPLLLSYQPDENWQKVFRRLRGNWTVENGWLIGEETGNFGGILLTHEFYEKDVMFSFTMASVLPATRDLNALFCARVDEENEYLGDSYVCGLNGWYEHKSGIERNPQPGLNATTALYHYEPGKEIRMICGAIGGHCFMVVDGELVSELYDPAPIRGGHVGFSPYCTKLRIKDIEVREIKWEDFPQVYEPEF